MRIIAGSLGGRAIQSPGSQRTHPMSDKMRGGLFNALGDIESLRVCDAFAGSGALGLEACSRGAASVVLVESERHAQNCIRDNINSLGVDKQAKLVAATVSAWLRTSIRHLFDVIMVDPPYDDTQLTSIIQLTSCLTVDGILVLSWPGAETAPELPGLSIVKQKSYGDGQLIFYQAP